MAPLYAAIALACLLLSIRSTSVRATLAPVATIALLTGFCLPRWWPGMDAVLHGSLAPLAYGLLLMLALRQLQLPAGYICPILTSAALWASLSWLNPLAMSFPLAQAPLAHLSLHQFDGKPRRLVLNTGRAHLLFLWQSDCRACLPVLATLNTLAHQYPHMTVVSINQGDQLLSALRAIKPYPPGKRHLALWDKHQRSGVRLGSTAVPLLILVDGTGQVTRVCTGKSACNEITTALSSMKRVIQGDAPGLNR